MLKIEKYFDHNFYIINKILQSSNAQSINILY